MSKIKWKAIVSYWVKISYFIILGSENAFCVFSNLGEFVIECACVPLCMVCGVRCRVSLISKFSSSELQLLKPFIWAHRWSLLWTYHRPFYILSGNIFAYKYQNYFNICCLNPYDSCLSFYPNNLWMNFEKYCFM